MTLEGDHGVGPTYLVIGAARAGTTAITRFLATHPDVFITTPKETHFFAFANDPVAFTGPGDDEKVNQRTVSEPARYAELYRHAEPFQHRGEGSVSTLYFHERSIPNIRRYAPDVKLVVLLRDPVERAYSSYLYLRSFGFERLGSFEEGLAAEPSRIEAGFQHMWRYRALSNYREQVQPFVDAFGRDRLHVIRSDRFWTDPAYTMAGLSDFLELEPFGFDTSAQVNRGGIPRRQVGHRLLRRLSRSHTTRRVARRVTSVEFRDPLRADGLERPPLDSALAGRLRAEYADQMVELSSLLDVDLTTWEPLHS